MELYETRAIVFFVGAGEGSLVFGVRCGCDSACRVSMGSGGRNVAEHS